MLMNKNINWLLKIKIYLQANLYFKNILKNKYKIKYLRNKCSFYFNKSTVNALFLKKACSLFPRIFLTCYF